MELFDSHAHYDDAKFNEDRKEIIMNVYNSGVSKFVSAGYDVNSSRTALDLANEYPFIYTISGISPNDIKDTVEETEKQIKEIEQIVNNDIKTRGNKSKIVGIGEIGLDYHWNQSNIDIQQYAFIQQIELANRLDLPIIIHSREAVMDTLKIIKEHKSNRKGIFHCCPFNRELVKEGLKLGYYISFAGPTTFKNSKNAEEIINLVPLDRMLIETDCPYLAPEPVRGTRNDSRNVIYVAKRIAEVKNMAIEDIAKITYQNALRIFSIDENN